MVVQRLTAWRRRRLVAKKQNGGRGYAELFGKAKTIIKQSGRLAVFAGNGKDERKEGGHGSTRRTCVSRARA